MPVFGPPDVSVVVPAYRAQRTLAACLGSLLAQRFEGQFEIILVASADDVAELPEVPENPALQVITSVPRLGAAEARNLAVSHARGDSLAFTDADVLAEPNWLAELVAASEGRLCVAGALANGTPDSRAGTVEYLVEFFDLSPLRQLPAVHGATANLLVPRSVWRRYGPFPEGMEGCEDTWLTTRVGADGLLRFAPAAVIRHMNRQGWAEMLRHQYALGGAHARLDLRQGVLARAPIRGGLAATYRRISWFYRSAAWWSPADFRRARRLAPLVVAGFGAWGAGLIQEARRLQGW